MMHGFEYEGRALSILSRAYDYWKPDWIFFLYSGGYDSVCSTHLGWAWAKDRGISHKVKVISADTGVPADRWRDYVSNVARSEHWTHEFWSNPDPEFYLKNVHEFGMPYTKQMHWMIMYRNLKERAFDALRAAHKENRRSRCMLVSGMRRDESTDRENTPEWLKDGAGLWVSPLIDWTMEHIRDYRIARGFPINPYYEMGLGSGDCQCNWGQFTTIEELEKYSPILAAKIRPEHEHCLKTFGWGYGERPTDTLLSERRGQMLLPGVDPLINLCSGCGRADPLLNHIR